MEESESKPPIQPTVNAIPPQQQPEQKTAQSPINPPIIPNLPPSPKRNDDAEHCRPDQTPWWKTAIELAAVLTAIWYAIVASRQLGVMTGQLTEMQKAREQAKIDNAKAITAQQGIAQNALITSQENFDRSSQSAENTFRDEQRAWVGAIGIADVVIKEGQPPSFRVLVTNSGRTPALHVRFLTMGGGRPKGEKIAFAYPPAAKGEVLSDFVLQPGAQYFLNSGNEETLVTKTQVDGITSGASIMWIFGTMTYEDVSKRAHHTKFCFILTHDLKAAEPCDTYNEAD